MDLLGGVFIYLFIYFIFSSNSILEESVLKSVIKPQGHPATASSHMHWKHFLGYPEYF